MSEAGPKSPTAWIVGTVVGIALGALVAWLFVAMAGVSYLPAAVVPVLLLAGWVIYGALDFGRTPDPVEDH